MPPKNRILPHPGKILLEEFMKPMGITGNALALALRVQPSRINGIIHGTRSVTADTALRLAQYFGNSPEFWLNLQTGHDLTRAREENGQKIAAEVRSHS
jgi:antitoxin HigA-1